MERQRTILFALTSALLLGTANGALGNAPVPYPGAPEGVRGWCTPTSIHPGSDICLPTPLEACERQHQGFARSDQTFWGYRDTENDYTKDCAWAVFRLGHTAPAWTSFRCEPGYQWVRVAGPSCVNWLEVTLQWASNFGANPDPETCGPIDILTGAKRFEHQDFALANGTLALNRRYNSRSFLSNIQLLSDTDLLAGSEWLFDFQYHIQLDRYWDSRPRLILATPEHGVFEYELQADGTTVATSNNDLPVTSFAITLASQVPSNLDDVDNQTSTWSMRDENDTIWTFETIDDGSGNYRHARVTGAQMRGGETLTFAYGAGDELISMSDGFGNQIQFTWISFDPGIAGEPVRYDAIDTATLPDGTVLNYVYDFDGAGTAVQQPARLVKVERLDGSVVIDSTTYHHEDTLRADLITGYTGHDGVRYWTVEYDTSGRAIRSSGPNGIDETLISYTGDRTRNLSRTVTNALGKDTIYRYSRSSTGRSDFRLDAIEGQPSANCVASTGTYAYDSTTDFMTSFTDAEGFVTSYGRDGLGRPIQITEAMGQPEERVTTIVYTPGSNQPATVAQPGLTQDFTYDAAGNLATLTLTDTTTHTAPYATNGQTRSWTYNWSTAGRLLSVDGPLAGVGDTVSYTYDPNGFLATTTDALGHSTTVNTVNGRGQPTSITDENGVLTTMTYDALGRIEQVTVNPGVNQSTTQFTYNALGLITRVTEPNGTYLDYAYDDARRVVSITNALDDQIRYTYNAMGGITLEERLVVGGTADFTQTRTYDELGRLLTRVGAGARSWSYSYDRLDQLTGITDPRANTVTQGYDGLRRLVAFTDQSQDVTNYAYNDQDALIEHTDPRTIVTNYVRNGFGETIRETSPDIGTIDYVRDARGLVTQRTDARGVVITYAYDDDGRLISENTPSDPTLAITYTYDDETGGNEGVGRVTAISDASGGHAYRYDAQGRLVEEQRTIGSAPALSVGYAYDASGNITQMTYPSGRIVTYPRDGEGAIARVLSQTGAGAPITVVVDGIDYEPFGPLQALYHGNGLDLWQTFDSDYRLDMLLLEDVPGASILHQRFHTYTDDLNLTGYFDTNALSGGDQTYNYNAVGRLQNATGSWGDLTFYHDGAGNRTFRILEDGGTTTTQQFFYPADSNRLVDIETDGLVTRLFTSDLAGNIIAETRDGTPYTFTHDARGRMVDVSRDGQLRASHVYDAFERLAVRTMVNQPVTGTVHYVHDQHGRVIAETDSSGQTQREYIWIDDRPVAVVDGVATTPVLYHVHTDHLNRPIAMTDGARNEVWRATFLPFGAVQSITGSASLDMRFPGQWFQLEAGFHHNWHRTYDPSTGRYLQPDPLGMPDGPSRWAYARSAATMYVDPTGEIAWVPILAGGLVATELTLSALDLISLADVWLDPCATAADRGVTTALTAGGLFLPGAGYTGFTRAIDDARGGFNVAQAARDARRMSGRRLDQAARANNYRDAHDLKEDFGLGGETDIFVDRQGNLYAGNRDGTGNREPLGINNRGD